ncbi:MAG: molybdopterin molybdotransferase MoeA [Pseudaminobacter sp.]|nr:molybdopterin molybdotransferase MoeA [Pseudaminobacter sp.]
MALLPVAEALQRLLDGAAAKDAETVPLREAADRVLAQPIRALRTHPPFDGSAMDGYALRASDVATVPARLRVIGEAQAGRRFAGAVAAGEAVRIFTGAPVPPGADTIVIQENARRNDEGTVEITEPAATGRHIRRRGLDFFEGDLLLEEGRRLDPGALSLAAAANHASLCVVKRPLVAIIAIGDELLPPGSEPGPDQIIASNPFGVAAIAALCGARVLDLGIAPDRRKAISGLIRQAMDAHADLVVTLGGASVGDHDLVHGVLQSEGVALDFWKIAMRPGKPLMVGRLGQTRFIGMPGNPAASMVCSHLFLKPLLARLGGRGDGPGVVKASLGAPMAPNDNRQDYVRASVKESASGPVATPFGLQDSSMLRVFADANALIVRAPFAPAAATGDSCDILMLR